VPEGAVIASNKKTRFENVNRLKVFFGQSALNGNFKDYSLNKLKELEQITYNTAKYSRHVEIQNLKDQYALSPLQVARRDLKKTRPTVIIPALQEDEDQKARFNSGKKYRNHISRAKELLRLNPIFGLGPSEQDSAEYHLRCANNQVPGPVVGLKLAEILMKSAKFDSAIKELDALERLGVTSGKDGAFVYSLRAKAHFWKGDFESAIQDMGKSFKTAMNLGEYGVKKKDNRKFFLDSAMFLNGGTRTKSTDVFAKNFLRAAKLDKNKQLTSRLYEYAAKLTENTHEALKHAKEAVLYSEQHKDERYLSALQTLAESHVLVNQKKNAGMVLKKAIDWVNLSPERQEEYQFHKGIMSIQVKQYLPVSGLEEFCKEEDLRTQALELIQNGQKNHELAKQVYRMGTQGFGNSAKLYQYAALLSEYKGSAVKCAILAVKESVKNKNVEDELTARQTLCNLLFDADRFDYAKKQAAIVNNFLDTHKHHKAKYHRIYRRMRDVTNQANWLI